MSGEEFETEVRRIARALWPSEPGAGASEIVDGRERDCIYPQEHLIHYVEITKMRTMEKVRYDAEKMISYKKKVESKGHLVKLWIVTAHEPTGDQRTYCAKNNIDILSIVEFRRRIIDAGQYLEIRQNYPFGSASNPEDSSPDITSVKYQPVMGFYEQKGTFISAKQLADAMAEGNRIVLLGDYGMGKSINIREIFLEMKKRYYKENGNMPVPIVLNLRNHWGQKDPEEALQRHAQLIGFDKPTQLIRGYHAGRLAIILDGFDEVGATPWAREVSDKVRLLRKDAVSLVKNFAKGCNGKCSLLVAGREHFFDSRNEMLKAFGLSAYDDSLLIVKLDEFSEDEAKRFLASRGYDQSRLPDWFPRRPLLLASLAARGYVKTILTDVESHTEPAVAWNKMVDLICSREAEIHQYLDAASIRRILESIATETRNSKQEQSTVTEVQIAEAFREVVGANPDEAARPLLLRLPGLSLRNQEDGTRTFMDQNFLDVLRAGDVARFIINPWQDINATLWNNGLRELGAQVANEITGYSSYNAPKVKQALAESVKRWHSPTLAFDCLLVLQELIDEKQIDLEGLEIESGVCEILNLVDLPAPINLKISNAVIYVLVLPFEALDGLSLDEKSLVNKVIGASKQREIPSWCKCEIIEFDEALSNAKIMELEHQILPTKVMMTILRKLYVQVGSGRRESALFRGLPEPARKYVSPVLEILTQQKLAYVGKHSGYRIWHAVGGQKNRALGILESSGRVKDEACESVKALAQ